MKPLRLIVCGALGRMGQRVLALAEEDARFQAMAGVDRRSDAPWTKKFPLLIEADLPKKLKNADVVIDFSAPQASVLFAEAAASEKKSIVIGTTGFDAASAKR